MTNALRQVDSSGLPLLIQPMRPTGKGWERVDWPINAELARKAYVIERYYNRAHEVQVLTAIEMVGGEGEPRAEYHVSITGLRWEKPPHRCSDALARWVLKEFNFTDYAQDNHVPGGIVRNYWRPVAQNLAAQCHCVETEPKITEDKGDFVWRP